VSGPRIGLLGGTFNPPHVGHLVLAECARDELGLDEVRLVLAARPPHKHVEDDPGPEERLALCRAAVQDVGGRLAVSDVELRRDGPSYTADTLEGLHDEQPDASFVLLLGGDAAAGLESWHRPEDVLRFAAIGVAERGADTHERARAAVARLAWTEAEDPDDEDGEVELLLGRLERQLELAEVEDDFLDQPIEVLIERIRREIGLLTQEEAQPVIARWRAAHPDADTS
jgi:nicotinate-nucleotide adenylyltransferase